ncbi:MAG: hypothetical protein Q8K55_08315 [Gemmatimonadaceae bacterium]|nr:hypothetical protein [Gemmatimonadaceae bacterium]
MLALLLALQMAAVPRVDSLPTDSLVRARVDSAIRRFQLDWRDAWGDTRGHDVRLAAYDNPLEGRLRLLALHCHWMETNPRLAPHLIVGSVRSHATCPIWLPEDAPKVNDERRGIDGALTLSRRWRVRELRRHVRLLLDTADMQLPGDDRIAAQRVRFAIDDGDQLGAVKAAAACARPEGYCGMLRGLVLFRAARIAQADSAFLDALASMSETERCAWNDVSVLMEREPRRRYTSTPCAERVEMDARFWWLTDPLWIEPGNERRAEQYARKTLVTLLAPLGEDERQRWRPENGGEAVAESLLRYGWPTQMWWNGYLTDQGHDEWLMRAAGADTARPYVVREYSRDRLHTVPSAAALQAPLQAKATDWTLDGLRADANWWPQEHYGRDLSAIVQLLPGQSGMLRRRSTTRFVLATNLDSELVKRRSGEPVRATMFASRTASDLRRVGDYEARVGRPLVVDAAMDPGPVLLGIEIPGDLRHAAGRTRFSADIVAPLSALAGAKAVSQPLLIEPPADGIGALTAEAAVARLFATTTFARVRRIGVYWEGYGFAATDTLELALALSREDRPGIFERVSGGFGLWGEDGGRADIRWTEVPGGGRTIVRMEGNVPVQMRSVALDLRRQRAGRYRLEVSMKTPGGTAVVSERTLVLR